MLTPYPASDKPCGLPSANVPKIKGSRPNSCKFNVMCEITTAIAAIALNPLSPGKRSSFDYYWLLVHPFFIPHLEHQEMPYNYCGIIFS